MSSKAVFLYPLLLMLGSQNLSAESCDLSKAMSAYEFKQAGLWKLSERERKYLEDYLGLAACPKKVTKPAVDYKGQHYTIEHIHQDSMGDKVFSIQGKPFEVRFGFDKGCKTFRKGDRIGFKEDDPFDGMFVCVFKTLINLESGEQCQVSC